MKRADFCPFDLLMTCPSVGERTSLSFLPVIQHRGRTVSAYINFVYISFRPKIWVRLVIENTIFLNGPKRIGVRCTINRSHSTPCKKAEFEHLQIFPGHCLDFFLSVSGKICHSPIKKVKRQPTLIISFSQHPPFFGEQSNNPG